MSKAAPWQQYMQAAIDEARRAEALGEVPVGAVIVYRGEIIARGHNAPRSLSDPTAHAEIQAIRNAAMILQNSQLEGCDLWVTLEPCAMCAGAISHARIARLYYGASDEKGGSIEHGPRLYSHATLHHRPEIYSGLMAEPCAQLLKNFFASRR